MQPVTPALRRLSRLRISNAWLVDGVGGDRWLVDTGHRLERRTLLAELRQSGLDPRDLAGVLLTHRHSDHAGNARFLQQQYGLRIHAHEADAAILAGEVPRPRLHQREGNLLAGAFCQLENYWPATGFTVDEVLGDGTSVGSMEVHWVGGHTPGSVFFRHAPSGGLVTGDLMLTSHPPLTVRSGFALPYPSFTDDMAEAHASLARFHERGIAYAHLLPGHGEAWVGDARDRVVEELAVAGIL